MYRRYNYRLALKKIKARLALALCYKKEISVVLLSMITLVSLSSVLVLFKYRHGWWYYSTAGSKPTSFLGSWALWSASYLVYWFGMMAFIVPILSAATTYVVIRSQFLKEWDRIIGLAAILFFGSALSAWYRLDLIASSFPGGFVGNALFLSLNRVVSSIGAGIVLQMAMITGIVLVTRLSIMPIAQYTAGSLQFLFSWQRCLRPTLLACVAGYRVVARACSSCYLWAQRIVHGHDVEQSSLSTFEFESNQTFDSKINEIHQDVFWREYQEHQYNYDEQHPVHEDEQQIIQFEEPTPSLEQQYEASTRVISNAQAQPKRATPAPSAPYRLPSTNMFSRSKRSGTDHAYSVELEARAKVLEEKLERFGVMGEVVSIKTGPVVTLFEYQPEIGTKLSKILALEDDLAMALQATGIRILAPIPGRSVVGFEVANKDRQNVYLADIVQTKEFKNFDAYLPLILGQDTVGNNMMVDLAKMPHLLIAGSTGSGKSVALNAMLVTLLCQKTPDELRLILIDPKRLEFASFADIAHLIFPIVADPRRAVPVLKWVVTVMEERYETMAECGVRNIFEYQKIAKQQNLEPMPFIVVTIDELADLMMTAGKEIEDLITRLSQMARAAGIHLIVATQRPSVDVITGLIKVNFPSRISFRVTSKVDSRTILDTMGAEKLLGRGDMLFLNSVNSELQRVHGVYVSDQEIERLVEHIRRERVVEYLDLNEEIATDKDMLFEGDEDLYKDVLGLLEEIDEVSISMLQRRFRIGYNRSARIIEMLESEGRIMPADGGKTRKVIR